MRGLSIFMLALIFVFILALMSHKKEIQKGQEDFQAYSKQSVNLLEGVDVNNKP